MLAKYITTGLVASALLATVASAQTPTATTDRNNAAAPASSVSSQGEWRASKIVGLSVYNDNNESIGSINDLLTDKSGNIKAVVIGVGGFLGVLLGGVVFEKFGSYAPIWWLSVLFGVLSALINLPIVEKPVPRAVAQPA